MAHAVGTTGESRVVVELQGAVDHLRLVWQTGEVLLEGVEFPGDPASERFNTLVAIQEIVTNVLRHAHRLDESLPVRVVFELHPDLFLVEVHDRGTPFDPRTWLAECEDATRAEVPDEPGGFGILIAALVMDRIDYEQRDDCNVLTMVRARQVPQESSHGEASPTTEARGS